MSAHLVIDDAKDAPSCSESCRFPNANSCTSDKEFLATSPSEQPAHLSNEITISRVCELILTNGDCYSGTLQGNMPERLGKYIWSDGCAYAGEWRRGMRHGKGKMLWPSGAVYEGEFFSGYMHGSGTYIGSDCSIYEGRWKLNFKHGLGYQTFRNGDTFEGSWIKGNLEGAGKYVWANGNIFIGSMRGGKMSGKGTLTWKNGDTFEGNWSDGMMHGSGVYTWSDGACFVGTWTRGLKDGKGVFYPKGIKLPATQEVYVNALRKRGLLSDFKRLSYGSRILHSSSVGVENMNVNGIQSGRLINLKRSYTQSASLERQWSFELAIEKVIGHDMTKDTAESSAETDTRVVTGGNVPILEREYMQGVLISELVVDNEFPSLSKRDKRGQKKPEDIKRPGETIIKGHRSYDLMLSLQLGIRYTVGKITPIQRRVVRRSDFGVQASFWMDFPKEGSKLTPPHRSEDFKWKDYCPMVFRNLREMFKIEAADYMMSICGNDALRELSSPGKSGSVFFLSQDDRFMIKTLRKHEVQVLLKMLPDYHHHVCTYENTLITKFFGLHRVQPSSGQKFRFVVMGNMFCTELRIHRRFDLKGSSLGRSANKVKIDENTILKDLDLNYQFFLEPSWREALLKQIEIDSKFLRKQRIMDYSLLLGVHCRAPQHLRPCSSHNRSTITDRLAIIYEKDVEENEQFEYPQGLVLVPRRRDENSVVVGSHIRGSRLQASSAAGDKEVDLLLPGTARLQIQMGVNMPARAEQINENENEGQVLNFHEVYDVVLYLGIIDILQDYNMNKKIEHAFKSLQFDSFSISAVDPDFYSTRFLKFIQSVFPDNSF